MQIIGFVLLGFIIWYGFKDRSDAVISAFDAHALVMVLVGSCSAVLVSSSHTTAWRTLLCLREMLPGLALFGRSTRAMEVERNQLSALWRDGKRSQAVDLAANSRFPAVKQMLELILNRANEASSNKTFTELRHEEISRWQPAIHNWEMLAKLGPAFGMVGTITGMIQLFRNMSSENLNIGASMSLALLATLYGVAFGAGVAGPIGHYLNGLLDDRLGLLERCEKSVNEIVSRGER
ncbi:MotA/TolQ/ExbB proton channel family protein [Archangium lansingense]|uniref:MotA/TolQ/ExbB proton channel family protein n=1 Tax=Archangium lansingense TaxID=2995310 RepID=A0ABT4AGE6_9BACT|nr:MotA/TolQ/ExbB proton channel family protein [Archangium lansinium]MCY1080763.1 MotA/TolQ/ExbB proton channel family protein [Archangium lansinium]